MTAKITITLQYIEKRPKGDRWYYHVSCPGSTPFAGYEPTEAKACEWIIARVRHLLPVGKQAPK